MDFNRVKAIRAKECEGKTSREAYNEVKAMTDSEVVVYLSSVLALIAVKK